MSARDSEQIPLEPERYELRAAAPYHFDLDRRDFFKFLGAGIVVVSVLKPAIAAQESGGGRQRRGESLPQEIDAWLHLGDNGKVTVYTGKVEVGQNIRTSLSQAVAEELHVPIERIELVMGDTQLTPFDMGTFGSRTTPTMNLQLRSGSRGIGGVGGAAVAGGPPTVASRRLESYRSENQSDGRLRSIAQRATDY
jgi:Molybdopterin-binding domain of aldehyde dehydrogenase